MRDMLRAGLDVDCAFGSGIALDAQVSDLASRPPFSAAVLRIASVMCRAQRLCLLLGADGLIGAPDGCHHGNGRRDGAAAPVLRSHA